MNVIRIATININGLHTATRRTMLTDFIRTQDLDIILLQEVKTPDSIEVPGYSAYSNVGSDMRGTAILVRRGLQVTDIQRVPTGRAVAVTCQGIRIVNIYAPSGTSRRADRERFYNADLSELLSTHAVPMLIGGILTVHSRRSTQQEHTPQATRLQT